jgi:hypothetical protein
VSGEGELADPVGVCGGGGESEDTQDVGAVIGDDVVVD